MKKSISILFLLILTLFLLINISSAANAQIFTSELSKVNSTYVIALGKSYTFKSSFSSNVEWSSSNQNVATINKETGVLTSLSSGRTTITATCNGESISINLFIWNAYLKSGQYWTYSNAGRSSNKKGDILVSKAYLVVEETNDSETFKILDYLSTHKGNFKNKYIVSYYNKKKDKSTDSHFSYSFKLNTIVNNNDNDNIDNNNNTINDESNNNVINNTITNTNNTNNTNTNTSNNGSIDVTKVVLSASKKTIAIGETLKIDTTISPTNASNTNLIWKSSNTKVATVDENGNIVRN